MKNLRHSGERLTLTAAAARTSGVPCVEAGFHGIPYTDAGPTGDVPRRYALVVEGVQEHPLIGGAAVGNTVWINVTTGALSVTAKGAAIPAGTEQFGKVIAIPGTTDGPPAGQMWVKQLPQVA